MKFILSLFFIFASLKLSALTYDEWKVHFSNKLAKHGINQETVRLFKERASYDQVVMDIYEQQRKTILTPLMDFLKSWFQSDQIEKSWISKEGRSLLKEHNKLLSKIEKHYKVDKTIVVALWGIESKYGKLTGKYPVLNALSTLAFQSKRQDFYSNELVNALKIIQKNKINPDNMLGSWAGAIGQCQFMPSNYFRYGVDFDKNKSVDLFSSYPDIFASIANYLKKNKWKYKQPIGHLIKLPRHFNKKFIGKKAYTNQYWSKKKVVQYNGKPLPKIKNRSKIISLTMQDVNYMAIYSNFDVIMNWNRSYLFGLKVLMLQKTF